MKPEPTPLRIASPSWGMGIWKRRKNSWIGSPGSPGIWGSCIWVRTGAAVVLMLTTAGPFCSTRAVKSGSALAADLWTCGVWACELDTGVSLPPSKPRIDAAAHMASTTANFFLDIGVSCNDSGNGSWATRAGRSSAARVRDTLCNESGPRTSASSDLLVLCDRLALHRLFAHHLFGARFLQDVGALLRTDPQRELDRGVAVLAHDVHVRAVPEQELHHLGVAPRSSVHKRRIAVLGDEVGIEVLREDLLRVDKVALLDGVEQHLDSFGALFLRLFFQTRRKQVHHVVDERKAPHGRHGDDQRQFRDSQALGHLAGHVRGQRQEHHQEEELELEIQEERDEYHERERAEQEIPVDIEALDGFLGHVGEGRREPDQDDQRDFPNPLAHETQIHALS